MKNLQREGEKGRILQAQSDIYVKVPHGKNITNFTAFAKNEEVQECDIVPSVVFLLFPKDSRCDRSYSISFLMNVAITAEQQVTTYLAVTYLILGKTPVFAVLKWLTPLQASILLYQSQS